MRILSFKQLKEIIPYCRAHIARLEKADAFPKRVRLGNCRVGWVEAEVRDWLLEKIAQRDKPTTTP